MPRKKLNDNKKFLNLISKFLILAIALFFLSGVFLYNGVVQLEDAVAELDQKLEKHELDNANLKNQLYSQLDFSNLSKLAQELHLVEDSRPEYLKLDSTSQHISSND